MLKAPEPGILRKGVPRAASSGKEVKQGRGERVQLYLLLVLTLALFSRANPSAISTLLLGLLWLEAFHSAHLLLPILWDTPALPALFPGILGLAAVIWGVRACIWRGRM